MCARSQHQNKACKAGAATGLGLSSRQLLGDQALRSPPLRFGDPEW